MRLYKISLVIWHHVFYNPSQAFVWFLLAIVNPLASMIFWRGAYNSSSLGSNGWSSTEILSYFLLLIIGGGVLLSQIEWDVAFEDIFNGKLSHLVLRPFNYIFYKFLIEMPWRVIQAIFGAIFIIFYLTVFHGQLVLVHTLSGVIAAICIGLLGYILSFIIKMVLGLTAFWLTEFYGLQQMLEVIIIVCAGFVMPLVLLPEPMRSIIIKLPFAYMIYFPLLAMIGKLTPSEITNVILYQICYLGLFSLILTIMWKKGIKKFTGLGN